MYVKTQSVLDIMLNISDSVPLAEQVEQSLRNLIAECPR